MSADTTPGPPFPGRRWRSTGWVLPAVVLVVVVVGGGLGTALLQSLGLMPLVGAPELSVAAYTAHPEDLLTSTALTLAIAAAATSLAAAIGLAAGLSVLSGRRATVMAASVTVTVPHLIGAATMDLLLADSGVLPRLMGLTGGGWPALVGGRWWIAVVAEYAWKESAFIALVVAGTLATRVTGYDETAATLGARRWARLRLVTLPLVRPALIASAAISFAYTVGSYEVARILGRAYPEPLPVMAVRLFTSIDLAVRPEAAAVAVTTTAVALVVAAASLMMLRRSAAWR
ncbi:MAG: ABC transporter permease subunit [Rhodococcus sp. (in: high G+C Gram-positive bacteria)]|uniref:ABC transporter permease subunit n=1 Tax=Rhodococcus sp. TaxID=1831 RepID=UPI003BAFCAC5